MSDYEKIYCFENLYRGFLKARRGKRTKASVAKFEANLLEAIHVLAALLGTKKYKLSEYYTFRVFEPKERVVIPPPLFHHSDVPEFAAEVGNAA